MEVCAGFGLVVGELLHGADAVLVAGDVEAARGAVGGVGEEGGGLVGWGGEEEGGCGGDEDDGEEMGVIHSFWICVRVW